MPSAGFEPAIPASDPPQTLALDSSATGIRSRDHPARSESLYRLSYPGASSNIHTVLKSESENRLLDLYYKDNSTEIDGPRIERKKLQQGRVINISYQILSMYSMFCFHKYILSIFF